MRLLCRLLGGHFWSDWDRLVFAGWATNGDPRVRYCHLCLALDYNAMGALLNGLVREAS